MHDEDQLDIFIEEYLPSFALVRLDALVRLVSVAHRSLLLGATHAIWFSTNFRVVMSARRFHRESSPRS